MIRKIAIFLLLCSCSPKSSEDFLAESEAKCSQLVAILEKVDSLEDLMKSEKDLKKKFNDLATLMIAARRFYENHPGDHTAKPVPSSAPLLEELKRIYSIKGGREIIERAQQEAKLY